MFENEKIVPLATPNVGRTSEKLKYIWLFSHLFVPLCPFLCGLVKQNERSNRKI